ncbi:hypothetical protein UK15_37355 [Streptomyces variegatus]|uniref:DUF397 domain-containing protein n=1 Tax=Streptomyces variegatus TaxID=284040 RepID=A0A0M2GGW6_9ACTN|nr:MULTISPECIES: DUF397 domain-containing protein [Streptomyces]KJK34126.1 hypothetical protein UK15_37355 [Streptomyces variegatus]
MSAVPQITSEPRWFKSSYSGGNATECLECSYGANGALIRDSKISTGPIVLVGSDAWRCFIGSIRSTPGRARVTGLQDL